MARHLPPGGVGRYGRREPIVPIKAGAFAMTLLSRLAALTGLVALSSACLAAVPPAQASSAQRPPAPGPASAPAPPGLPKVCLDVHSDDSLTREFADRLGEMVTTSGALSVASPTDSCDLQLHVPGNLLRFETAGGVMVSTVVIVTSASGRYLSSSITACLANDLKPCAVRAVAAAKLAVLAASNDGT